VSFICPDGGMDIGKKWRQNIAVLDEADRVATNLKNLEKSGNLTLVREKSWKVEKVRENVFACGVLPQLQWSQNKHSLTA